MANTDCFNNIVGISKQPCSCLEESDASLSGLYLDDTTPGTIPLNQMVFSCNDATITTFLTSVITSATHEVLRRLRMSADKIMRKNYLDMNTVIGWRDTWTQIIPSTTDWQYIVLRPKFKRGLYFKIDSINVVTGNDADFEGDLNIADANGDTVYSGDITMFEGVTIKMDQTWYIMVQKPAGSTYKNISAKTCCGYNATYPTYVDLGSGTVNDYADLAHLPSTAFTKSTDTRGIIVEGQFICDGFDFICKLDFNTNFGSLFANTVQQQARLALAMWLMTNDKVTNYTLLNAEQMAETMKFLSEKIDENIKYLPTIYHYTDCYACPGSYKGAIMI